MKKVTSWMSYEDALKKMEAQKAKKAESGAKASATKKTVKRK